jgi:hypothetical protein
MAAIKPASCASVALLGKYRFSPDPRSSCSPSSCLPDSCPRSSFPTSITSFPVDRQASALAETPIQAVVTSTNGAMKSWGSGVQMSARNLCEFGEQKCSNGWNEIATPLSARTAFRRPLHFVSQLEPGEINPLTRFAQREVHTAARDGRRFLGHGFLQIKLLPR